MGRGRAKAKQQKVARELKYNTHFTDLDALQRELGTSGAEHPGTTGNGSSDVDDLDEYDPYADVDSDSDEYQGWTGTDR
jgi:hypothetical protein